MGTENQIVKWPGYGEGAIPNAAVTKIYVNETGNTKVEAYGNKYDCHPCVRMAYDENNNPVHAPTSRGVFPIRWQE